MSAWWEQGERDALLTKLWRQGVELRDLVERFGVSKGSVQRRVRTLGLDLRAAPTTRGKGEWTVEEDARLRGLWLQTEPVLSLSQIGREMKKTKNAVMGKAQRLGLPERGSPIVRAVEGAVPANPLLLARLGQGGAPLPPFHPIARAVLEQARRIEF
jgi:hypothetical protein